MPIAIPIPELPPLPQQLADYATCKPLFRFGYKHDGTVRLGHPPPNKGSGVRNAILRLIRKNGSMSRAEVVAALPERRENTVDWALKAAVSNRQIERYGRARYRLCADVAKGLG